MVVGERTGRTRLKHELHVQGHLSSMISSDGGLVRAVIRALGTLATEPLGGSLLLDAFLLIDPDGTAVVVDRRLAGGLRRLGPKLRRARRRVIHLPHLDVWPDRATAVVPDAAAATGVSVESLDARWPLEPGDDDLVAGEAAISRMIYAGRPHPESRADATAEMVPLLRDPTGRVARAKVAHLAALTARVPFDGVFKHDQPRLAAVLGLT